MENNHKGIAERERPYATSSVLCSSPSTFSLLLFLLLRMILITFHQQPATMSVQVFPTYLGIPPQTADHSHTFILLRERCSNFGLFERSLLACRRPVLLPTARRVFPAAPKSTAAKSVQAASRLADSWLYVHPLKRPEQDLNKYFARPLSVSEESYTKRPVSWASAAIRGSFYGVWTRVVLLVSSLSSVAGSIFARNVLLEHS